MLNVKLIVNVTVYLLDLYCTLEVDSFGFFLNKAKTRVYRYTTEPKWNEVRRPVARRSDWDTLLTSACCVFL